MRGPGGMLLHQLRLFFTALQFFTRLPVPRWVGFDPAWLHQASRYFPAVGVVVGAISCAVYIAAGIVFPPWVAVLLSTAAGIYATGAFHEDGFADTCDGFGGGMTPARVLEIMKDSRIGAYGAIGIGLLLAMKCATLAALPRTTTAGALLLAHPLSRLASVALIWRLAYVKDEGKAKPLAQRMSGGEFAIACLTVALVAAAVVAIGWLTVTALSAAAFAAAAAAAWLARKFVRRIGGYTGDCLGAVQQLAEVAAYLAILAMVRA
ncbi:adenosylcobinamide-GDP ribazoletransferase [Oxalobacteraceae bacterium OM1]|nr:adenosylcobinamide-GDP ribazoletransferase [Oxalobacteraceae bacterium OM1]